jgi:N-acyl-D-amino-acid deacylase
LHNIIIRNGTIYDGSGSDPYAGDIAINGQFIAKLDNTIGDSANIEIDASGLAVAPGFINMLSWANESLIADGRSQSDIRQGVTLEVMGEGSSMGPWNDYLKEDRLARQGDIKYDITWSKLSEFLQFLVKRGVSCNIASFVGATTIRRHVIGDQNRQPNKSELLQMQDLVRQAMQEGAVGVSSALIYAPAFFAKTDELIALAKAAAEYDGMHCSHLRSEGNTLLEALDEFLRIAEEAKIRSEIYHLKAAGKQNWYKMDKAIAKIETARKKGLPITASMYMYTAAGTGFDAAMPPEVQEGGEKKWIERLRDPSIRERLKQEMTAESKDWENGFLHAGPDGIILAEFKTEKLKPLAGKTLAEVAKMRGTSPEETIMDLVAEDESQIGVIYFWMSEDNICKQLKLPWVSFCSDASSQSAEGIFLKSGKHPRAYGNFARLLGKYVREEKIITLAEAIRRLTSLPATNLRLDRRGALKPEYFADIVIFDPNTISDHSTFANPHQYSTGVIHVFVNGTQVLKDGQHTGALAGQIVNGPGKLNATIL